MSTLSATQYIVTFTKVQRSIQLYLVVYMHIKGTERRNNIFHSNKFFFDFFFSRKRKS